MEMAYNSEIFVPTKSDYLLLKGQIKNGIEMRCGGTCVCTSCACSSCVCSQCGGSCAPYVTRDLNVTIINISNIN
jgi:hypothetical protein